MEDLYKEVSPLVLSKTEDEQAYGDFFTKFDEQITWYLEASEMAKASLNTHARLAKKRELSAVA